MAGVYVKGMKMPECCEDCRFWDGQNNGCPIVHMITLRRTHQKKPDWCPLVEVPDHGDLVDIDNVLEDFAELNDYDFALRGYVVIQTERSEEWTT